MGVLLPVLSLQSHGLHVRHPMAMMVSSSLPLSSFLALHLSLSKPVSHGGSGGLEDSWLSEGLHGLSVATAIVFASLSLSPPSFVPLPPHPQSLFPRFPCFRVGSGWYSSIYGHLDFISLAGLHWHRYWSGEPCI